VVVVGVGCSLGPPGFVTIGISVNGSAVLGARNITVADANGSVTCTGCHTITPQRSPGRTS